MGSLLLFESPDDALHQPISRTGAGHPLGQLLIELGLERLPAAAALQQLRLERAVPHLLKHGPEKRLGHKHACQAVELIVLVLNCIHGLLNNQLRV